MRTMNWTPPLFELSEIVLPSPEANRISHRNEASAIIKTEYIFRKKCRILSRTVPMCVICPVHSMGGDGNNGDGGLC